MRKVFIKKVGNPEQVLDDVDKVEAVGSFIAIVREVSDSDQNFLGGTYPIKGKITYLPTHLIEYVRDEFDFQED